MESAGFWVSVLSGIVASVLFLFIVLFLFKPKVLISPHICRGKINDNDPEQYYFIKIINLSLFSAYDVKLELLLLDRYTAENNQMNVRVVNLRLITDHVSHIPGYRPSWFKKNAPYAIRIRTQDDLTKILANDYKSIVIKVSLRHGLTGLAKVKSKEYTDISKIKKGRFKYGLSFGILD